MFDCIYCANEKVVFEHSIKTELYKKYDNKKDQSEKVVKSLMNKLEEYQLKEELKTTILFREYKEECKKAFLTRKRKRKCTHKRKAK